MHARLEWLQRTPNLISDHGNLQLFLEEGVRDPCIIARIPAYLFFVLICLLSEVVVEEGMPKFHSVQTVGTGS